MHQSLSCGLFREGWFYAYWFMPFGQGAEVKLINEGRIDRRVEFEVYHTPLADEAKNYARFHAK